MRKLIDRQVRRNDGGISAIKTICNVHGIDIARNVIEDGVPLNEDGASLDHMQKFLEEYGFETEWRLLDIHSINGNYADIKDFFPCITPVKNKDTIQYVVIDEITKDKLNILDPAKQDEYTWSVQEFRNQAHFQSSYLDFAAEEDVLLVKLKKELEKRTIPLPKSLSQKQVLEMHSKVTYFNYVEEYFGFKNEEAGIAFLNDLLFNQKLEHIPAHFQTLKSKKNQIEINAPVILTVKKTPEITPPEPVKSDLNIYRKLYESVGELKELWFIFLSTILLAAFISYIAVFIDQILIDHILPSYQLGTLQLFAIGVGVFYLIEMIFKIYSKFISIHLAATLDRFFVGKFDEKLNTFSLRYLSSFKRGDLIERMRDSMKLKSFFVKFFSQVLVNVIIASFSLFFLVLINWQLSLFVLLVLVLFGFQFVYFTPLIERLERKRYIKKADFVSKFIEKIDGIQVVKSLGLESYSSQQIKTRVDGLIDVYIESKYVGLANTVISSLIVSFATLLLIILTSRELILYNSISLGMIITFVALSKKIFSAFTKLLNANLSLQEHKVILQRFFDFNENKSQTEEVVYDPNNKKKVPLSKGSNGYNALAKIKKFDFEKINLRNISFAYEPGQPVLKNVSMEVCKGDKIWIQGKNGSGKSTICKIMTQLYQQDSGDIMINDIDVGMYNEKAVNKKIALIAGKDILFNDTLLFNITFGKKVDIKELIEYAKMIDFYDFINEKPDKFNFIIHEGGKNLSTGQRRKILLLRAMVLDAEVLILDEVFNGIDKESKRRAEFMLDLIEDKTIIIISHMPVEQMTFNKKYLVENGILIDQNT